jgi:transcriptional regulator GlxA family with amidase domain
MTTGIVVFDDAEELDFAGPWEVFTVARFFKPESGPVVMIAQESRPIRCNKGMRVLPDHTFADAPPLDVIVVPGGQGTSEQMQNPTMLEWLKRAGARAQWVTSVCTGAAVLHAAGFLDGKRATTHWMYTEALEQLGVQVVRDRRYVRDGNVVTAAGVSAGIDMALWLVGQIHGPDLARAVQRGMEYNPAPPYAAEV